MNSASEKPSVFMASSIALLAAAALLVTLVLPAEYGWDPLGTGDRLGLLGMTESAPSPLKTQAGSWHTDSIEFELAPFESVEYKYYLATDATLLYHWRANGIVVYDLHTEPDRAAQGYSESFEKSRGKESKGSYIAPYEGIHGWFWQNRSQQDITLRLETSGFYAHALEMRDGNTLRHQFDKKPDSAPQP